MTNFIEEKNTVEIGSDETLTIEKMFGPTIFADLRITADCKRGWVIERQWIGNSEWIEWCVIPAQIASEFDNTHD